MTISQTITDLPNMFFPILTQIASTIGGMLTQTFGAYETYAVMGIAIVLGYILKSTISRYGDSSYFVYILLSALIFLSMRYLGI